MRTSCEYDEKMKLGATVAFQETGQITETTYVIVLEITKRIIIGETSRAHKLV